MPCLSRPQAERYSPCSHRRRQKYNGAVVRIFNNTKNKIEIDGVIENYRHSQGTARTENLWDTGCYIEPYTYMTFQCEFFDVNTVCLIDHYREITKANEMQKIADVAVGDKIKVVGGIIRGDDGYKVYGGTSPSDANILFQDTTSKTTIRDKVRGFEKEYTVLSNPACTAIYANVEYDDTYAYIGVYQKNKQSFYGWKNNDTEMSLGYKLMSSYQEFYSMAHGWSSGSGPWIDGDGYLRFTDWTREDGNGGIWHNG